ncbi:ABC transporter ATP-binding protein [Lyngbya confervoides]|uniref:Sn-glycerol-3-phosphate ABC transporter ATP-binding protein UgpC n=1 Tax=Lyngbya confervoides BDU141951 TaxID=1574623 RepID=A0ABD4T8L8_9CYAN|nr:sn-glycerol-3-phosphate ABC transporter ATP-binding protein UgpC [Lyngbya confervoides]MCM1984922.1 sn-glycerol-3-phosphate ABC transporter ATP-binding protein UgpC [Lyngbya confervoides BDU141951]
MAKVVFEQVSKRYENGFVAVNHLNLDIDDREFLVLVGPSGCGKTTTLRMLAGLEDISAGNILIGNTRVNDVSPKDRDIAMVFQSYALYPHMTVFENMAFSLDLKGIPKAEIRQRVQAAAQQLGIEALLDRKPRQLSGGQRQRVAVGRAIVRNPAVFLMDEPLSNLDAKLRVQARAELSKLHQSLGTTFVYVTHDQVEAMTMGTRIAVMNQGVLQQVDRPERVYEAPQNVFVAGFLGSPSMNFLNATLQEENAALVIKTAGLTLPIPESLQGRYRAAPNPAVIFGIRPESIYHPAYLPPGIEPFAVGATVGVVEPMGHERIVYFTLADGQELVARIDPRAQISSGERLDLLFDLKRFHLFERDSEQVL